MAARAPAAPTDYDGQVRVYYRLLNITQSGNDDMDNADDDYDDRCVKMERKLVKHVKDTIRKLEIKSGKKVNLMYFGKTYVKKNKK